MQIIMMFMKVLILCCGLTGGLHAVRSQASASRPSSERYSDGTKGSKPALSVLLLSTWLSGHQTHLLGVGGELVKRAQGFLFNNRSRWL